MPKPLIHAAIGLIIHNGRCLISKRRKGSHQGGLWEFPGGKFLPGEPAETCLHREVREETGMGVTIEEAFPVIEHVYPERTVRLYFFRCTPEKKDETLPSGSRARWVPLKEIDRYAFPEANKPILKLLRNYSWGES